MHQRGDLTRNSQLVYLSQWLGEFSEVEKDDFLQQLLDFYAPGQLAIGHRLAPLKAEDKAPTLFDCRIDLFKQWFGSWESSDREEFLDRLREADPDFMERFQKSKDTPNEDKIVEEFWLRLDNGASEDNGNGENGVQPAVDVQENGTGEVRENGNVLIQENGSLIEEPQEAPAAVENGTSEIQENGNANTKDAQENGNDDLGGSQSNPHELGSIPIVQISSPVIEAREEDDTEAAENNVPAVGSEPVRSPDEESTTMEKPHEAVENGS